MDFIASNWNKICENLKKEYDLTDIAFNTWIKPLEYLESKDNTVYILIQSDQAAQFDYINKKYSSCFKVTINEITGQNYEIEFISQNDINNKNQKHSPLIP